MTTREVFRKRKRSVMSVALAGFFLAAIGSLSVRLEVIKIPLEFAFFPGIIIFLLALSYANLFAFHCPQCGRGWGMLPMRSGSSLLEIDKGIRFCPFCGLDIDAELASKPAPANH